MRLIRWRMPVLAGHEGEWKGEHIPLDAGEMIQISQNGNDQGGA